MRDGAAPSASQAGRTLQLGEAQVVASHIQAGGGGCEDSSRESGAGVGGLKADRRVRRVLGGTGDSGVQEGGVWI